MKKNKFLENWMSNYLVVLISSLKKENNLLKLLYPGKLVRNVSELDVVWYC